MNSKYLILFVIILFGIQFNHSISGPQPIHVDEEDALKINDQIAEGVNLSKKKKFQQAKNKFTEALQYWQHHYTAMLYLKIIDDAENNVIKEKYTVEIFKSLQDDYNVKPKKALKRIKKVIKKNKSYFPAYIIQGEILTNLEDPEQAELAYSKAADLSQASILPYISRGKFYATSDDPKKAIEDFSQAISIDPSRAISFFERGFVYCLNNKYDDAITDFESAVKQFPEWGNSTIVMEAFHNRGVQRMQKKSYRGAIKDFTRSIDINPEYLNAYLNRGIAYKKVKKYSQSLKDFSHCVKINPASKYAYYNRALLNYDRGQYRNAIKDLSKIIEWDPGNKKMLIKFGQSYYQLGQFHKAVVQFDKIIALDSKYSRAYYWKGFALEGLKKPKQAIQSFQTFIALEPPQNYKRIALAEVEIKKLKKLARK